MPHNTGMARKTSATPNRDRGKLRIGDDWNAIRIIALSQSNPLKAVAEFVENSIDARATAVVITRGREHGAHYLSIRDNGQGIPRDADGVPDFKYVATHICDSVKRRLKSEGAGGGLQGEFGIGLLSFWTVGESLVMSSAGADGRVYQMTMSKGDPGYEVVPKRTLFPDGGTELKIAPLLEGIRSLTGEKIQWYLASELRDRIREAKVGITVVDKLTRKQYEVEPRQFDGRLLHQLAPVRGLFGEAYAEIYLCEPSPEARVALTRLGTRVVVDIGQLPGLEHSPWTSCHVQGLLDVPFLQLTPGTRSGIVQDERYAALIEGIRPLEAQLDRLIEEQRKAEEEQANQQSLKVIQKAFHEALLALPPEEYDWFDLQRRVRQEGPADSTDPKSDAESESSAAEAAFAAEPASAEPSQRRFFEFAGPLFTAVISPASAVVALTDSRTFRALPRDRSRRRVTDDLTFFWEIVEGEGALTASSDQEVTYQAPTIPGLARLRVTVRQRDVCVTAEAVLTLTERSSLPPGSAIINSRGLPGYTFERAAGALWRCRFDSERNLIIVNSGHRDFVYARRHRALQMRYLVRLYVKELVMKNFAGAPPDQLLERMVELSLYAEEQLKG